MGVAVGISPRVQRLMHQRLDVQEQEEVNVSVPEESVNSPFLCLFVLFELSMDWIMSTTLMRSICFTQFANSNKTLSQIHPGIIFY